MAQPITFFISNTQVVQLSGLRDRTTGLYQNAAAVTATLNDPNGTAVTGISGATLNYVGGSNGVYSYTVPSSFSPSIMGSGYTLTIIAVSGGSTLKSVIPAIVAVRDYVS